MTETLVQPETVAAPINRGGPSKFPWRAIQTRLDELRLAFLASEEALRQATDANRDQLNDAMLAARAALRDYRMVAMKNLVGLRVHLWMRGQTPTIEGIEPIAAELSYLSLRDAQWQLTQKKAGHIQHSPHRYPFAEVPTEGCWSWMPNGIV